MPPDPRPRAPTVGVVVPLRSFHLGKARLAERLAPRERRALAATMADRVVDAAGDRAVAVVSSAPEVVAWAHRRALDVVDDPGTLDAAADAGRTWARAAGHARVVVVHGDLPWVSTLDEVVGDPDDGAVLVRCHRDDGSPVVSLPVDAAFRFSYGPGSFDRHRDAARAAGLRVRVVDDPALRFDVDLPEDLDEMEGRPAR